MTDQPHGEPTSDPDASVGHHAPPEFGDAPRELTRRVRARVWREKHVRAWAIMFIGIAVVAGGLGATEGIKWVRERNLILNGRAVDAKRLPDDPHSALAPGYPVKPGAWIAMRYELDGVTYREVGRYDSDEAVTFLDERLHPLDTKIRVDPENPRRWTSRKAPRPIWQAMFGAMMLVPLALVLLAGTWISRRSVLKTYRDGAVVGAEVVNVRQGAMGPGSKVVRCVVSDETGGGRVITTVIPAARAGGLSAGDVIWLLALPGRSHKGVPAALFE